MPDEQHGDDRHLVTADLKAAAAASGISVEQAWTNVQKSMAATKSTGGNRQPAMATGKPGSNGGQANTSSTKPAADNRQPAMATGKSGSNSGQANTSSAKPAGDNRQPAAKTNQRG